MIFARKLSLLVLEFGKARLLPLHLLCFGHLVHQVPIHPFLSKTVNRSLLACMCTNRISLTSCSISGQFSKISDEAWVVSEGVLSHVKSTVQLRFQLGPGYTFVRVPEWIIVPRSVNESKVLFKMA